MRSHKIMGMTDADYFSELNNTPINENPQSLPPKVSYDQWMDHARQVAQNALPRDVPVGAILVWQNQIIAQAFNRRELDTNPVAHAEILVLQKGAEVLKSWRLNETQLYVTLEPCPMCASAIQQARVGSLIFGAYDSLAGACGSKYPLLMNSNACKVIGGIQEKACAKLLRDFFRSKPSIGRLDN